MKCYLIAAEDSGDTIGACLAKALSSHTIVGMGGKQMAQAGVCTNALFENFRVMGFSDVLKNLWSIMASKRTLVADILANDPDCVVCIDAPGLNLRVAKTLRRQGFRGKIVQYVSPTVWAWKAYRVQTMEKVLDHLFYLYPFEEKCYTNSTLATTFVGHPLHEMFPQKTQGNKKPILSLFPGSRQGEITRTFPQHIATARCFLQQHPHFSLHVSVASPDLLPLLKTHAQDLEVTYVPKEHNYSLMEKSSLAIATSGTITLELAYFATPTLVLYGLSRLNQLIAKAFQLDKLPYYCLVNLLANAPIFPEHIKQPFCATTCLAHLNHLLINQSTIQTACHDILSQLRAKQTASALVAQTLETLV